MASRTVTGSIKVTKEDLEMENIDKKRPKERGDPKFKFRNSKILAMREMGVNYKYIGRVYDLSPERVRQIVIMMRRNVKNGYSL